MASIPSFSGSVSLTDNEHKRIPLLCCVCPDTPQFSDVSHLLTHIASKGHLHHETQTKLRAHEDPMSSHALQQYEQWYRDNGIEALLVHRMKAKQNAKKKSTLVTNDVLSIKTEPENYLDDDLFLQRPMPSEINSDLIDESPVSRDSMSLKGQVWPGMGKMDLANEDMRRTRNQRKPKWVVERMRRASEGIEPTQVVMSSQLIVERVKGVYDDDTSDSEQERMPAQRSIKPRSKKPQPLAELSANIPRGGNGREPKARAPPPGRTLKRNPPFVQGIQGGGESGKRFRPVRNSFYDDDPERDMFDGIEFTEKINGQKKFAARDQFPMHTLNTISHPILDSPSRRSCNIPLRVLSDNKGNGRERLQGSTYFTHGTHSPFAPFSQLDGGFEMGDDHGFRREDDHGPLSAFTHHIVDTSQTHYPSPMGNQSHARRNDYHQSGSDEGLGDMNPDLFLDMSNTYSNPLLPHDRIWADSYHQTTPQQPISPLELSTVNSAEDCGFTASHSQESLNQPLAKMKTEPQECDTIDSRSAINEDNDSSFDARSLWSIQNCEADPSSRGELRPEVLGL